MLPIREFAELVIETAVAQGGKKQPEDGVRCTGDNSRDTAGGSSTGDTTVTNSGTSRRTSLIEGAVGGEAVSAPLEEGGGSGERSAAGEGSEEGTGTAAGGRGGENVPKTALSNMAARESHKEYPGSMVDEVSPVVWWLCLA